MQSNNKAILLVSIAALFSAAGQIFYKFASNTIVDVWSFILNPFVILGVLSYGTGFIFMLKALLHGEVTVIYPIMAINFIIVALLSPIFFNDSMSIMKWIGIIIIILGVYFVAKGATGDKR